jgi:hypothetical protein
MSREIPYQPDPKPPGPSFDHMQSVLDKHAKRLGVGQSPKAKSDDKQATGPDQQSPPGLVWSQPQKGLGFVYIDSGPYRITRTGKKYECHRECYYLGTRDNAEAAKEFCATHFATQAQSVKT